MEPLQNCESSTNKLLSFLVVIMSITILLMVVMPKKITVLGNDNSDVNVT